MTSQQPRRLARFLLRRRIHRRVIMLRIFIRKLWERTFACSIGKPGNYKVLTYSRSNSLALATAAIAATPASPTDIDSGSELRSPGSPDMDLVSLKICLLGDDGIGKTSFLVRSQLTRVGMITLVVATLDSSRYVMFRRFLCLSF